MEAVWTNTGNKTGLGAGRYVVQARDSIGPCYSSTIEVNIDPIPGLFVSFILSLCRSVVNVSIVVLTLSSISVSLPKCHGESGIIELLARGGTNSQYRYSQLVTILYIILLFFLPFYAY